MSGLDERLFWVMAFAVEAMMGFGGGGLLNRDRPPKPAATYFPNPPKGSNRP